MGACGPVPPSRKLALMFQIYQRFVSDWLEESFDFSTFKYPTLGLIFRAQHALVPKRTGPGYEPIRRKNSPLRISTSLSYCMA